MALHQKQFDLSDKNLSRELAKQLKALPSDVRVVNVALQKSKGYGWVASMRYESDDS